MQNIYEPKFTSFDIVPCSIFDFPTALTVLTLETVYTLIKDTLLCFAGLVDLTCAKFDSSLFLVIEELFCKCLDTTRQGKQRIEKHLQTIPLFSKIMSVRNVKMIKNKNKTPVVKAKMELPNLFLNKASLLSYIFPSSFASSSLIPMKLQLTTPL